MPCNMMDGYSSGDAAWSKAEDAQRRIYALEQALCGLCQQLEIARVPLHAQLAEWYTKHKARPGCGQK
jgi:hypothetical protein